jgi:tetratricopeptide (TPR) repeat protein
MGYAAMPPKEALPRAREAAARAIELDPWSAEAHATHGFVRLICDWDAAGALAELRQAVELNPDRPEPHQWLAWCLVGHGEIAAGLESWQRALEADPLSAVVINENGWPYSYVRLDEQAVEWYRRAIEIDPALALAHYNAGWALHRLGRLDEAIPAYERGVELSGGAPFMRAFLATAFVDSGRTDDARRILDDLLARSAHAHGMGLSIGMAAEALGEQELALDWLDRAFEERDPFLFALGLDDAWMDFGSVRDHPRFIALLDRIGIGRSLPSDYIARERAKILARMKSTGESETPESVAPSGGAASNTSSDQPDVATHPRLPKAPKERNWVLKHLRRPAVLVAAVVAVAATVMFAVNRFSSEAGAGLHPDRVAVQVFRNATADPSFDELGAAAGHWITQGLQRAGVVQVVPWETSLQSWRFVEGEVGAGRLRDPLQAFAAETGVGTVVSGTYYLDGDSLQFQADVTEATRGTSRVALDPVRGSASEPMRVVEALRERVLGSLAVSFDERLVSFVSSGAPPPTLEASRAFQRGIELYLDYVWSDAVDQFLEAARLDTTFHTALVYAASSADIGGDNELADSLNAELHGRRAELSPVEAYVVDAAVAAASGDYAGRIRALERAVAIAPGSYWTYRYARELKQANRLSRAIEVLTTQLQPEKGAMRGWAAYWALLAGAYHQLGDHESELAVARRAREVYPDRLQLVSEQLYALGALGRIDEAMALWHQSANMDPDWGGSPGVVLVRTGRTFSAHGYPEAAQRAFETAVDWFASLRPEDLATGSTGRWYARALYEAGRLNEAHGHLERLEARSPGDPSNRRELGIIAAKRGDREEAMKISDWLAGLEDPGERTRSLWRGMIAAQLGDREEAVRLIRVFYDEAGYSTWTTHHSAFNLLRDYPPFQELMRPKE